MARNCVIIQARKWVTDKKFKIEEWLINLIDNEYYH